MSEKEIIKNVSISLGECAYKTLASHQNSKREELPHVVKNAVMVTDLCGEKFIGVGKKWKHWRDVTRQDIEEYGVVEVRFTHISL